MHITENQLLQVADFGLSKALDRDIYTHASTNTLVGTPGYVDPEYVHASMIMKLCFFYPSVTPKFGAWKWNRH